MKIELEEVLKIIEDKQRRLDEKSSAECVKIDDFRKKKEAEKDPVEKESLAKMETLHTMFLWGRNGEFCALGELYAQLRAWGEREARKEGGE